MATAPDLTSMRMRTRFVICLLPALFLVSWLPVYPHRAMTRSQVMGHMGDVITWRYELSTLPGLFEGWRYMRLEENAVVTLVANLTLWLGIASVLALIGARVWARRMAS
jgi:hypothetical protein